MAALRTVDLASDVFNIRNAWSKPPRPQSAGKFHNRGSGKLFPATCQNRLFDETTETDCKHVESPQNGTSLDLQINTFSSSAQHEVNSFKKGPNYMKRTQSAKAKTTKVTKPSSTRIRPKSASYAQRNKTDNSLVLKERNMPVIDLCDRVAADLTDVEREKLLMLTDLRRFSINAYQDFPPMHFSNPLPNDPYHDQNGKCFCKGEKQGKKNKKKSSNLEPSVYGLLRQRQVFGSAPDLTSANINFEQFPYKFSKTDKTQCLDVVTEDNVEDRSIPATLSPLLPWLNDVVPEEVTGVNPGSCLIFLPDTDWSQLPEVPFDTLQPEYDLPFVEDVTTPRPWNPKKYSHPFNKQPVEEWVCRHTTPVDATGDDIPVYRVRCPRMRSAEMVRQEISDLENLLKGVGRQNSECGLSQYQSEISDFNEMFRITMDMVPDRLKNPEKPVDTFGLKKFCKEHDLIIDNIRLRIDQCREELGNLEVEAGIETERRHFRTRSNSVV